ncbi:MAG: GNAT family N-acetyltransferase [Pseudomonadota bacterium]
MQQHETYAGACRALGMPVLRLGTKGAIRGEALVLIRRWPFFGDFALIARGPIWRPGTDIAQARAGALALISHLRQSCRGVILTGEPLQGRDPMAESGLLALVTGGIQARLPLSPPETLMARMHGKWRNRLRRAQDGSLRIDSGPLPDTGDHWLLTQEEAQARARGYRRLPARFTRAWRAANGARSTRLFVAKIGKTPVAGMLFLCHGKTASYHIGWSSDIGRRSHAHNLLLWRVACWFEARGYTWIDLGTLDTETTPGLARFKLGAGAHPVTLGATYMAAPGAGAIAALFQHRSIPNRSGPAAAPASGS